MQAPSKGTTAALLAFLLAVCTAESQGSQGLQDAPPLNASQLIAAARDPSLISQQVVELAVTAALPGLPVNTSAELWQGLQSPDESTGIVSIELRGKQGPGKGSDVGGAAAAGARAFFPPRPASSSSKPTL